MVRTIHERSNAILDRAYYLTRGVSCKTAITVLKIESQLGSVSNTTKKIVFEMGETKLGVRTTEAVTIESMSDIKQIKLELAQKNRKDEAYKRQEEANNISGIALERYDAERS